MLASHRLWFWIVACCGTWLMPTLVAADEVKELIELHNQVLKLGSEGKYSEAIPLAQELVQRGEKVFADKPQSLAIGLTDLASLYDKQTRYTEAEPLYQRALKLRENALGPDHLHVAVTLQALALLYDNQARYAEAEPLHQRALKWFEKALGPEHLNVAAALDLLAGSYLRQARYAEAEPLFQRALKLYEKALRPDNLSVAMCLNNIALLSAKQARYAEAEPLYERALKIKEKALGPEHPSVAETLSNFANLYDMQARFAEAEPHQQRALKLFEKAFGPEHPYFAGSLQNLVVSYINQARYAEAEPLLDRAIAIRDRAGVGPDSRSNSYLLRSRIAWKLQDRQRALADLRKAMDLAESARQQASGAERERAEFFSTLQSAFEQMIAWQQELGDAADLSETLSAMERSRSRSLLDDLSVAGTNLYLGRPPSERDRLQREEVDLKSRAAQLEKQWTNAKTPEERNRLLPDLAKAREAVYQHYRDLRASSPVYRQLLSAGGSLVTLRQLQQTLTPDNSLLLVYFLGEQAGYVVSIQADRVKLTSLTVNTETAKDLGCNAGPLTAKLMQSILMNADKTGVLQKLSNPTTAQKATAQLATLWPLLVPEEAREQIHSGKLQRLMIVPDGPLGCLPFETLVIRDGDAPSYLLDVAPPIQYAPSATVLFNLQQKVSANPDPTLKPVLAIGNANYGQGSQTSGDSLAMLKPGARYAKQGGHLQPLPYSGTEVSWVSDVFGKQGIAVGKLLQADATEAKIRYNIPGRRIVHFACHGLVDQEFGNFFGSLAVTPGSKAATDPSDDGFLTLAEIYQIDFKSCELAILSACNTNFGPHQKGEGTWAMSRGCLVAGAKRVAASNWLVDDEAAAILISYFTGGIALDLGKSATPNYAKRLHDAKKQVRQQEKWASPYYWGGFVLVGPE